MLYLVSTPIGNLEDITLRGLRVLREADVIIAEDTRHLGLLLKHYEIPHKPLVSLYDEVEAKKLRDLLPLVSSDQKVVLVSDAGTPLISDPGYKLVRDAMNAGAKVEVVPGPTALIAALTVSGMPPDKFLFLGYPPEKESHCREQLENIKELGQRLSLTVIYFVAPHKLIKFNKLIEETQGDVEIAIARELTKVYEEVWRGRVSEAFAHFKQPKGEMVVMFHL